MTAILANAIKSGRIAHAYLFTGPRGVGKTSIARILAHAINELPYEDDSPALDIIEIDAASNNGVDDIRDLREKVNLAPVSAKKKVYIIDEVHMLSKPAFNALLKTLEEPPEHVVFILATTDADKLPETIVSRTQRHTFRRAAVSDLVKNLKRIVKKEKLPISDDALALIAEHADGSYRDSVSLLDQIVSVASDKETITPEMIENSLGLAPKDAISKLADSIGAKDFDESLKLLDAFAERGVQASIVAEQLIRHIQASAQASPELLGLIDGLLQVATSPIPGAKLLAVIGLYTGTKNSPNKTVSAPVSTPIPALTQKAVQPHPKDDLVPAAPKTEIATPEPPVVEAEAPSDPVDIDWDTLMKAARAGSIALASVLTKCGYTADGSTLTLYARNDFYKKKLDNPKYRQLLQAALQETTHQEWEIEVVPGVKPSADGKIAAITAMMGGGEEVELTS